MSDDTTGSAHEVEPQLIDHIGFLVANLEEAIERWSIATGYEFSPIARYRTATYADSSNEEPHWHDARISFSRNGKPQVELMEFHGDGTHSSAQGEGFHHLGFVDTPDTHAKIAQMEALGFRSNGRAIGPDGEAILWFTDKDDLNGVRLEFVAPYPQPIVDDDGNDLPMDDRGRPDLFGNVGE